MQRRVADVLGAKVYVKIQRNKPTRKAAVAETKARYGNKPWPEKIIALGAVKMITCQWSERFCYIVDFDSKKSDIVPKST